MSEVRVTRQHIVETVARRYGVAWQELTGPSQKAFIVRARQEAMWLMHQARWSDGRRRYSLRQIAEAVGRDNHTTAWWGVKRHAERLGREVMA